MADTGNPWTGPTFWESIIGLAITLFGFLSGIWIRGNANGKEAGGLDARMNDLSDRVTHVERKIESGDEKLSKMAERIAETPTRTEIAAYFGRLESRLDSALANRRDT